MPVFLDIWPPRAYLLLEWAPTSWGAPVLNVQVAPTFEHPDRRCPLFLYPWVLPWFVCLFSGNAAFISRGMAASTVFVLLLNFFVPFFVIFSSGSALAAWHSVSPGADFVAPESQLFVPFSRGLAWTCALENRLKIWVKIKEKIHLFRRSFGTPSFSAWGLGGVFPFFVELTFSFSYSAHSWDFSISVASLENQVSLVSKWVCNGREPWAWWKGHLSSPVG